jgi:hypothetical protein
MAEHVKAGGQRSIHKLRSVSADRAATDEQARTARVRERRDHAAALPNIECPSRYLK